MGNNLRRLRSIPIRSTDPPDILAPRRVGTMTLFPHYFSDEVVPSAGRRTQRPPRIVLRMFHPADGENSGASLGGSVLRNGITIFNRFRTNQVNTFHALAPAFRRAPSRHYIVRTGWTHNRQNPDGYCGCWTNVQGGVDSAWPT